MRYDLHKRANASLHSGCLHLSLLLLLKCVYKIEEFLNFLPFSAINLKEVVKLPVGEDLNDWVAVHGDYLWKNRRPL